MKVVVDLVKIFFIGGISSLVCWLIEGRVACFLCSMYLVILLILRRFLAGLLLCMVSGKADEEQVIQTLAAD